MRLIGLATALIFLLVPLAGQAQQAGKVYRLGYLSVRPALGPGDEAFVAGLRELGYIEGRNLSIEWRFFRDNVTLRDLATELAPLKLDCIVTFGVAATRAVMDVATGVPIVMTNASDDPVRHGLVASLARPGGNVTGFIDSSSELSGKRLELLKAVVPKASRIGIVWDPTAPAATGEFQEATGAARTLGLNIQSLEVRRPDDFAPAFLAGKERTEALVVVALGGLFHTHRAQIVDLALKTRLPAIYTSIDYAHVGGLMSYTADLRDHYRRAAIYVDRILKGSKAADLPVQRPTKFLLVVNMKTAKALGLTIPQSLLVRADEIIQ